MKKVVFDGECPVCTTLRTFAENKMESNELDFIPYQSENFDKAAPNLSLHEAEQALYILTENGRKLKGAKAVFEIMSELSGVWGLIGGVLKLPPFYWIAEPFYRLFARHRHNFGDRLPNRANITRDLHDTNDK